MANLKETGGFSINGKWATRIAYEADLDSGQVTSVELKFIIGRTQVARGQLSRAQALEVLGYKNLGVIEEGATERKEATQERVKGELRGPTLHYRQATLPGEQSQREGNTIERESLLVERERPESSGGSSESNPARRDRLLPSEAIGGVPGHVPPPAGAPPESRRTAQSHAIPHEIAQRFVRVDNQFYFPDRSLAFVDRGTSLKAESENLEVVRSLVAIAQARGWEAIRVNGTESFRRSVWREAMRQGLLVRGYTPTDVERAEAERESVKREVPQALATPANEVHRETRDRGHEINERYRKGEVAQRQSNSSRSEITVGRLLEHGPAHYQFDEQKAQSYFVRLETPYGPQLKWGVDLERAFAASRTRPQVGDEIGVELLGARQVTVRTDVLDEAGRAIGRREVAKHRNSWVVEKQEYFEQRSLRAAALRDEGRGREEIAREHPELAGALATIHLAELFASQNVSMDVDRARFVQLVRDAIAHAIEHEIPVPAPKVRETRACPQARDGRRTIANHVHHRQSGGEPVIERS